MLRRPCHRLRDLAASGSSRDDGQIGDAHHDLEIRADDVKMGRPMLIRIHPSRYPAKPVKRRHGVPSDMECTLCTSRIERTSRKLGAYSYKNRIFINLRHIEIY